MSKEVKPVSGYCPVLDAENTIIVEYETRGQGAAKITKAFRYECQNHDHSNPICSRCPIFYAPTTQTPS